jgi:recombination protein RecA
MPAKQLDREAKIARLQSTVQKKATKWGTNSVSLGSAKINLNVVPSPSWMLDYKTGIGGFPFGHMVEVFGSNSLGKSSAIAYPTISNVQAMDKIPALIAAEPALDIEWMKKNGVDPELMLLLRPDHAEEAFEMIHDLVYENEIDYIVLDSLGALAARSEEEKGGKKAYGISGTVTSGLNSVLPRMYKNNIGMLILNQQRQAGTAGANGPMQFESPGGEGLHHNAVIRIQLKPGKDSYKDTLDGEEVLCGRQLICTFKKNKMAFNSRAARFDFYYVPSEKFDNKFGVDRVEDVIRTGKATGVIQGAGYLEHPAFPGGKIHGKPALARLLSDQPDIIDTLRGDILKVMTKEQLEARAKEKAA